MDLIIKQLFFSG